MKRPLIVLLLVIGLLAVAGCGSSNVTLDSYGTAVQSWLNEYKSKVDNAIDGVEGIENPLAPTDADIAAAKNLVQVLDDCASGFGKIKPTSDLETAHKGFLQSLEGMSDGAEQFSDGLQAKDVEKVIAAFTTMGEAAESGKDAQETLQEALGIQLD